MCLDRETEVILEGCKFKDKNSNNHLIRDDYTVKVIVKTSLHYF